MADCLHCGGRLFPDRDGDYQCLQCGRYAGIAKPEPDVEPEPVYPTLANSAEGQRTRYQQRRDAGLCTKHGGDVKAVRQGLCAVHLAKTAAFKKVRNLRLYTEAITAGKCIGCKKVKALAGYVHCADCKENIRLKSNAWYRRKGGRVKCACGKWFFRLKSGQRYHALDCPANPRKQSTLRVAVCQFCGGDIPNSTRRRLYCGKNCGYKARYRAAKTLSD